MNKYPKNYGPHWCFEGDIRLVVPEQIQQNIDNNKILMKDIKLDDVLVEEVEGKPYIPFKVVWDELDDEGNHRYFLDEVTGEYCYIRRMSYELRAYDSLINEVYSAREGEQFRVVFERLPVDDMVLLNKALELNKFDLKENIENEFIKITDKIHQKI